MKFCCKICGSTQVADTYLVKEMMFGLKDEYLYERCSACGVIQLANPVTDPEKLYPSTYYSFNSNRSKSLINKLKAYIYSQIVAAELGYRNLTGKVFGKFRNSLEARALKGIINKKDKILDIGCGTGDMIKALFTLGFKNVSGIDPFIACDVSKPVVVLKKYVNELNSENKYDLIMMHHSLEHMDDPLLVLKKIKALLSVDGNAIIRIPVADSYAFKKYQNNWYQFDAPRHVFLHTNGSIEILAMKAGLRVVSCTDDSTINQFIGSEQYKRGIALNSNQSYYRPFLSRLNPFKKKMFEANDLKKFKVLTQKLNMQHEGDQRIYILKSIVND